MAKVEESTLLVQLELQNRSLLTEVNSWSIDSDYLTATDGFQFECYSDKLNEVRGLEMQPVELKVNGTSQVIGRIDKSDIGNNGQAITYSGRDYIADAVECSTDPNVTITEEMDLFAALTTIAAPIGIDTIVSDSDLALRNIRTGTRVGGKAGPQFQALKASEITPEYGEPILNFASRIVSRHGATIQPANNRNTWLLTAPDYDQPTTYSVRRTLTGENGNIISGSASRDFSSFPTFAIYNGVQAKPASSGVANYAELGVGQKAAINALAAGQGSGAKLAAALYTNFQPNISPRPQPKSTLKNYRTTEQAAGFAPAAEDIILGACHIGRRRPLDGAGDALKLYRLLAVRDDKSRTQAQVERLAAREVGERLKDLLVYECTVQGHVDPVSGAVWSVDTLVNVVDEVCDISETLWIASRTLKYDPSNGATTTLTCWRPGAFLT